MATRNLRTRMSSRLSSPAVHAEPERGIDNNVEMEEGPIEEKDEDDEVWREPPVRVLPPSYKDHKGLERIGVLEEQLPLGVPPPQKLLQRLKLNLIRPSNRGTPLPDDEIMSQGLDSEMADVETPVETDAPAVSEPEQVAISSPPRGRPTNKDTVAMHSAYGADITPSPVKYTFEDTPQPSASSARPTSIQEHLRQERVQTHINKAIEEAQEHGNFGLVPGLEKIRRNANDKRDLWRVLEAITQQNPTPEQLHIFKKFIKNGLRKYRTEVRSSSATDAQPFLGGDNGVIPESSLRSTAGHEEGPTFTSPFRARAASGHLHPESATSRRSQRSAVNGRSHSTKLPGKSPRRKRRGSDASNASSSSLSSAQSVSADSLEEDVSGSVDEDVESGVTDGRGAGRDGRQAGEATSAAPRLRLINKNSTINPSDPTQQLNPVSSKIISEKLKKSQLVREEAEQEAAEIEKRRKRHQEKSFVDYNYIERKTLNDRHRSTESADEDYDYDSDQSLYNTQRPPSAPAPILHPDPVGQAAESSDLHRDRPSRSHLLMNGTSRKRDFDEFNESDDESEPLTPLSSSPAPPYEPPPPPPNARLSRSGTPRASTRISGPPTKVARKSARVMISPNKPKNGGITAGFTRAGPPARIAELGGGADSSQEDNDEHCASCGGEGILLCCDGCTNSFHHSCLEPPLNPDDDVDGQWFCPQCEAKRKKSTEESKTFLGKPLSSLDHIIPRAFQLPVSIREYFEGVRTGEEGEYVEHVLPRTHNNAPKMNRAGLIEVPNYTDARDSKGKLLICKGCGNGANGRAIIPCDYCDAKWHLDCLDPPLSLPPRRKVGDNPGATWRCPLHLEQDMTTAGRNLEAAPGELGGQPRLRKPKNAIPIDVDFPRGFRNNGIIEVVLEDDVHPIRDVDMDGHIYRIPEQAIKLDFIDRVKRSWYEDKTFPYTANGRRPPRMADREYRPTRGVVVHEPKHTTITIKEPEFYKGAHALSIVSTARANAEMRRKTLPEQQAVLSLASMANNNKSQLEGASYSDALLDLTNALIAEAPDQAAQAQVRDERASLQHLQSLIDKRMRILDGREGPEPAPPAPAATVSSDGKISRAPTHKYSRAPRAEKPDYNAMRQNLRPLQPAMSSPHHQNQTAHSPQQQQSPYASANAMSTDGSHSNGQQQMYFGAAPPPQPGQQAAYPFPSNAVMQAGGNGQFVMDWQQQQQQQQSSSSSSPLGMPKQAPLQANVSPWQPPAAPSLNQQHSFGTAGVQQNAQAGSPVYGGQQTLSSSYPNTPLALQQGQQGQTLYGPRPPSSVSMSASAGMQRQVSLGGPSGSISNGAGEGSRRASLPGQVERVGDRFHQQQHQPENRSAFAGNTDVNASVLNGYGSFTSSSKQQPAASGGNDGMIDPALFSSSVATGAEAGADSSTKPGSNGLLVGGNDGDIDVDMHDPIAAAQNTNTEASTLAAQQTNGTSGPVSEPSTITHHQQQQYPSATSTAVQ